MSDRFIVDIGLQLIDSTWNDGIGPDGFSVYGSCHVAALTNALWIAGIEVVRYGLPDSACGLHDALQIQRARGI